MKRIKDNRLLPCPFCGEDAEITCFTTQYERDKYYVGCSNDKCGCDLIASSGRYDLDKCIAAWNTRKLVKENGQWTIEN